MENLNQGSNTPERNNDFEGTIDIQTASLERLSAYVQYLKDTIRFNESQSDTSDTPELKKLITDAELQITYLQDNPSQELH